MNESQIARDVGVDRSVIRNYFSILKDLLLATWLPPFTKRAKRRLVRSQKFYFFDVGVYHQLRPKGVLDRPSEIAGAGLETLFLQILRALIAYGNHSVEIYYWRTVSGVEVDFVLYGERGMLAVEIKHANRFDSKMLKGLKTFRSEYPVTNCYLGYLGDHTIYPSEGFTVMPFKALINALPELLLELSTLA